MVKLQSKVIQGERALFDPHRKTHVPLFPSEAGTRAREVVYSHHCRHLLTPAAHTLGAGGAQPGLCVFPACTLLRHWFWGHLRTEKQLYAVCPLRIPHEAPLRAGSQSEYLSASPLS